MKLLIKPIIAALGLLSCLSTFGYDSNDPTFPRNREPQDVILIGKELIPGQPEAPARITIVLLQYGNGYLQFAIPDEYEYLNVCLYNNMEEYTGTVNHADPIMEIPELEGQYSITCTADNGRVFTGTLDF